MPSKPDEGHYGSIVQPLDGGSAGLFVANAPVPLLLCARKQDLGLHWIVKKSFMYRVMGLKQGLGLGTYWRGK